MVILLGVSFLFLFFANVTAELKELQFSKPGTTYNLLIAIPEDTKSNLNSLRQNLQNRLRMTLRSNGCSCIELICGCCLDFNIAQFNFQRTGCMNFTADPQRFSVKLNMLWDENTIFENEFSGKNPPPICVPLPIPYIPSLDACVRIFDISVLTDEQRVHACIDVDTRIERAPLLVLHFDCLKIGTNSLMLVKPTESHI